MSDTPNPESLPKGYVMQFVERAGLSRDSDFYTLYLTDVYLHHVVNHAAQLEADVERLRKELDAECMERSDAEREARTLAHWKAEVMVAYVDWERVWEALGEPETGVWGMSKAKASLAEVERLLAEEAVGKVSKAFHDVAVAERNLAWRQLESRAASVDAVRHEHVLAAGDRLAAAARAVRGPTGSVAQWNALDDALAVWTALVASK